MIADQRTSGVTGSSPSTSHGRPHRYAQRGSPKIVSIEGDRQVVAVRGFGQLKGAILSKTKPVDDSDMETPYLLTIEHDRLPSNGVVHDARNKDDLDRAYKAFATAFRP